ncbi:hypothetical protein EIP75_23780 [Aquabacterium soli]|uniref:Uncharacterized protein n=1 Tax=Aquabacterium soli TaxID=2493092 RepID=A0A3R8S3V6_9BURK|nr:hypothetical protein [Aquabacterium soli]RRR99057.1 hypothetical protein EIP75_23780 [Aquabacterium soli]
MSESEAQQISKEKVATPLYFASLYFVTVGVLYLWGYWLPFGINILEYLSLTDVLKATAYPIATALVLTSIGAAIGEGLSNRDALRDALPPGGGRNTTIGRFLRKIAPLLAALYAIGTGALWVYGPIEKWTALPVLIALPVYMFAKDAGLLKRLIPHDSPRSIVIYVLATLPPLAYGHGVLAAHKVQTGQSFTYVTSTVSGYAVTNDPQKQLRLIGHVNDTIFLLDPAKTATVVVKLESGQPLVLMQYESAARAKTPTAATSSIQAASTPSSARSN